MAVFVAGMLVLILLAVILAGWMGMELEREMRRQCCALREELAKVRGELSALFQGVRGADGQLKELAEAVEETGGKADTLISGEAGIAQSLSGLLRESQRHTVSLGELLAREDAAGAVAALEGLLREAAGAVASADEEESREMLEGIENLMRYSLSTAREKGEAGR